MYTSCFFIFLIFLTMFRNLSIGLFILSILLFACRKEEDASSLFNTAPSCLDFTNIQDSIITDSFSISYQFTVNPLVPSFGTIVLVDSNGANLDSLDFELTLLKLFDEANCIDLSRIINQNDTVKWRETYLVRDIPTWYLAPIAESNAVLRIRKKAHYLRGQE